MCFRQRIELLQHFLFLILEGLKTRKEISLVGAHQVITGASTINQQYLSVLTELYVTTDLQLITAEY